MNEHLDDHLQVQFCGAAVIWESKTISRHFLMDLVAFETTGLDFARLESSPRGAEYQRCSISLFARLIAPRFGADKLSNTGNMISKI